MARFRRRSLATRPVQRIKHVVDNNATVASAVQFDLPVILATDTPTLAVTNSVITGSKVYGIYLKVLVSSNEAPLVGAIPNVYMIIFKNTGGNLTVPTANAVGSDDNKRYVLHQEMSMNVNIRGDVPTVLFDGVVKIPKTYNRFGPNDTLLVSVLSPFLDIALCIQVHYKEFR